ncbi:hypothetical protein BCAR13_60301 [Paraburkholderia caribensis]|nr:hypothetical protein BCAR13_60301 [Paraburkholderia caribensis]
MRRAHRVNNLVVIMMPGSEVPPDLIPVSHRRAIMRQRPNPLC